MILILVLVGAFLPVVVAMSYVVGYLFLAWVTTGTVPMDDEYWKIWINWVPPEIPFPASWEDPDHPVGREWLQQERQQHGDRL